MRYESWLPAVALAGKLVSASSWLLLAATPFALIAQTPPPKQPPSERDLDNMRRVYDAKMYEDAGRRVRALSAATTAAAGCYRLTLGSSTSSPRIRLDTAVRDEPNVGGQVPWFVVHGLGPSSRAVGWWLVTPDSLELRDSSGTILRMKQNRTGWRGRRLIASRSRPLIEEMVTLTRSTCLTPGTTSVRSPKPPNDR